MELRRRKLHDHELEAVEQRNPVVVKRVPKAPPVFLEDLGQLFSQDRTSKEALLLLHNGKDPIGDVLKQPREIGGDLIIFSELGLEQCPHRLRHQQMVLPAQSSAVFVIDRQKSEQFLAQFTRVLWLCLPAEGAIERCDPVCQSPKPE